MKNEVLARKPLVLIRGEQLAGWSGLGGEDIPAGVPKANEDLEPGH